MDGDEVGEQDGRISEQVGPHTGQAEETIWGHVDISLHRAGFGDEPRRKISGTSVCLFGGVVYLLTSLGEAHCGPCETHETFTFPKRPYR